MKRTLTLFGLSLMFLATAAFAQKPMDEASEKHVKITGGPNITNITGNSATIHWATSSAGANHVRYRVAGSNSAWKSAFHSGGGTDHTLQLSGLEPGKTYEWQILTRDGDLRQQGQFQTAGSAGGTAPDVNAGSNPPPGGDGNTGGAKVPLYRSSNSNGSLHLYTTNVGEQNSNGFHGEGTAGFLLSAQASGAIPLYRMTGGNNDTLLTTDANERTRMQASGYRDGGIVGYVATSQFAGTQPFHRMVNTDGSIHFYTAAPSEVAQFQSQGWKEEGIVGYIWTQ
jgi:Purple acid Phosphatase, N-terminal domain/Repeat of unknown function (DUF5648)